MSRPPRAPRNGRQVWVGWGRSPPLVARRHQAGIGRVGDVENMEAVEPIAHVKPVTQAQRMVAAQRRVHRVAGVGFAAGLPLTRRGPAADLFRPGRIGEVEDHDDVAHIALDGRRDIGVAAVEIVAVDAVAGGRPLGDKTGPGRVGHIVDRQATVKFGLAVASLVFVIDDHQAIGDPHLVGMPALGDLDFGHHPGMGRVGHVDHGGAVGMAHVADVQRRAVDPDLTTAGAIQMGDLSRIDSLGHQRGAGGSWGRPASFQAVKPPSK